MIKETIKNLEAGTDLSKEEMGEVFDEIMSGGAATEDIKAFLKSLAEKGETTDEVIAAAGVMRQKALKVDIPGESLVDTCGTGGARVRDINVSTLSAIVLAASGVKVAKHGNRSFTGKCGSADLLDALGINIHMSPEKVSELIEKTGFAFMFAPDYHPAMKNVMQARRELAMRTIFNILGPLSNPAGAGMQIVGVFNPDLTGFMAAALLGLGAERALIVHGMEGLDEISIKGKTKVSELKDGKIESFFLTTADFGMGEGSLGNIKGGDPKHNVKIAMDILGGKKGDPRNMVLINAAAILKMIGKSGSYKEAARLAAESIDSGKAIKTLDELRKLSNK